MSKHHLFKKEQGKELAQEIVRERLKNSSLADDVTTTSDPDLESFRKVVRSALKRKKSSTLDSGIVKKLAGI